MLIGREHEQSQLSALVGDAAHGRGRALLVRGAAGIGKSALLEPARQLEISASGCCGPPVSRMRPSWRSRPCTTC